MNKDEKPLGVCVLAFPTPWGSVPLNYANLFKVLGSVSEPLYIVTGGIPKDKIPSRSCVKELRIVMHRRESIHPIWLSILIQVFKILAIQLEMSWALFKVSRNIAIVFFTGSDFILLPLLLAKALRKKVAIQAGGRASKSFSASRPSALIILYRILEKINYSLVDQIAVQAENAVQFLELQRFRDKIAIYGAMYIDTKLFKIKSDLKQRGNLIGYIGNLAIGKGVMNFVEAMPLILKERDDIEFLIGGDGLLSDTIKERLGENNLQNRARLTGWIPHEELPNYLNELKLLILPSYSEGLPAIVQEAMACGAIILATPVGGIPDLIKDGETGFIMENNSPECIASNVIRALKYPKLDEIVRNARKLIGKEYSYEALVAKCKYTLGKLIKE